MPLTAYQFDVLRQLGVLPKHFGFKGRETCVGFIWVHVEDIVAGRGGHDDAQCDIHAFKLYYAPIFWANQMVGWKKSYVNVFFLRPTSSGRLEGFRTCKKLQ